MVVSMLSSGPHRRVALDQASVRKLWENAKLSSKAHYTRRFLASFNNILLFEKLVRRARFLRAIPYVKRIQTINSRYRDIHNLVRPLIIGGRSQFGLYIDFWERECADALNPKSDVFFTRGELKSAECEVLNVINPTQDRNLNPLHRLATLPLLFRLSPAEDYLGIRQDRLDQRGIDSAEGQTPLLKVELPGTTYTSRNSDYRRHRLGANVGELANLAIRYDQLALEAMGAEPVNGKELSEEHSEMNQWLQRFFEYCNLVSQCDPDPDTKLPIIRAGSLVYALTEKGKTPLSFTAFKARMRDEVAKVRVNANIFFPNIDDIYRARTEAHPIVITNVRDEGIQEEGERALTVCGEYFDNLGQPFGIHEDTNRFENDLVLRYGTLGTLAYSLARYTKAEIGKCFSECGEPLRDELKEGVLSLVEEIHLFIFLREIHDRAFHVASTNDDPHLPKSVMPSFEAAALAASTLNLSPGAIIAAYLTPFYKDATEYSSSTKILREAERVGTRDGRGPRDPRFTELSQAALIILEQFRELKEATAVQPAISRDAIHVALHAPKNFYMPTGYDYNLDRLHIGLNQIAEIQSKRRFPDANSQELLTRKSNVLGVYVSAHIAEGIQIRGDERSSKQRKNDLTVTRRAFVEPLLHNLGLQDTISYIGNIAAQIENADTYLAVAKDLNVLRGTLTEATEATMAFAERIVDSLRKIPALRMVRGAVPRVIVAETVYDAYAKMKENSQVDYAVIWNLKAVGSAVDKENEVRDEVVESLPELCKKLDRDELHSQVAMIVNAIDIDEFEKIFRPINREKIEYRQFETDTTTFIFEKICKGTVSEQLSVAVKKSLRPARLYADSCRLTVVSRKKRPAITPSLVARILFNPPKSHAAIGTVVNWLGKETRRVIINGEEVCHHINCHIDDGFGGVGRLAEIQFMDFDGYFGIYVGRGLPAPKLQKHVFVKYIRYLWGKVLGIAYALHGRADPICNGSFQRDLDELCKDNQDLVHPRVIVDDNPNFTRQFPESSLPAVYICSQKSDGEGFTTVFDILCDPRLSILPENLKRTDLNFVSCYEVKNARGEKLNPGDRVSSEDILTIRKISSTIEFDPEILDTIQPTSARSKMIHYVMRNLHIVEGDPTRQAELVTRGKEILCGEFGGFIRSKEGLERRRKEPSLRVKQYLLLPYALCTGLAGQHRYAKNLLGWNRSIQKHEEDFWDTRFKSYNPTVGITAEVEQRCGRILGRKNQAENQLHSLLDRKLNLLYLTLALSDSFDEGASKAELLGELNTHLDQRLERIAHINTEGATTQITLTGDSPGQVATVAEVFYNNGINISHYEVPSAQKNDIYITGTASTIDEELIQEIKGSAIVPKQAAQDPDKLRSYRIQYTCPDSPGVLYRIAFTLSSQDINIEEGVEVGAGNPGLIPPMPGYTGAITIVSAPSGLSAQAIQNLLLKDSKIPLRNVIVTPLPERDQSLIAIDES